MHDILQEDANDPNNGAAALKHINQQVRNKQCSPNLGYQSAIHLGLKKKLFVSCNGQEKNRVGRSTKTFFLHYFFWSKMGVLCMFHVDWELGGPKIL